jgi:hypothetical protein
MSKLLSALFVSIIASNANAGVSVKGLPKLSCSNENFRHAFFNTDSNTQSLEIADTMTAVEEPELLEKLAGTEGIAKKVKGFRITKLNDATDSCRHLSAAPFILTCQIQFATADLLDEAGKVLAAVKGASISVKTTLSPWNVTGNEDFTISAELRVGNSQRGANLKFARVSTRVLWFSAEESHAPAYCKRD